jgi:CheY-like chemotaxis protein
MAQTSNREAILIIEDDVGMASVLREGLEHEQYWVTVAGDGWNGLEIARQRQFGAIVLDVMLPVMDGYSLARDLRSAGNATPIIMLTARIPWVTSSSGNSSTGMKQCVPLSGMLCSPSWVVASTCNQLPARSCCVS